MGFEITMSVTAVSVRVLRGTVDGRLAEGGGGTIVVIIAVTSGCFCSLKGRFWPSSIAPPSPLLRFNGERLILQEAFDFDRFDTFELIQC